MQEVEAYFEYLSKFKPLIRPKVPKFDLGIYLDKEYIKTIDDLSSCEDFIESVDLDIERFISDSE